MRKSPAVTSVFVAVLVATLALAACSSGPSDEAIATDVKAKFFSDPQLKSANISVASKQGVITLTGEAPSDGARLQAFKVATQTKGVVKVEDQMTVATAQAVEPAQPVEPERAPAPAPKRVAHKPAPAAKPKPQAETQAPAPPPPPAEPAHVSEPALPLPPPEPQPVEVTIPAGEEITIRMIDSVDSEVNRTGEVFRASLDNPIVVDGDEVVPAGTDVYLRLAEAKTAGRMAGRSELRMELARMVYQGRTYPLSSSTYEQTGKSRGKDTAAKVGGGAAIGAAIGAIAGGGKGAAIGAVIGAGGGTAVQVFTKGQQIRIPSETTLEFRLDAPVEVTYLPGKNTSRRSR